MPYDSNPRVYKADPEVDGVVNYLFIQAVLKWMGFIGLFAWLSFSLFPNITQWLTIIYRSNP